MKLTPRVQNEISLERKEIAKLSDGDLQERCDSEDKFTDADVLNGQGSEAMKFFTLEYRKLLREESSKRNQVCPPA